MTTSYKFIAGLGLALAVAVGGYYAWDHNASRSDLANLSADAKLTDAQVGEVVNSISKFLVVPTDENPSVVVIKGSDQLAAQQSFYRGSRDGDLLVLYSARAIIYDPVSNQLVNVGPVVRNDTPPADTTASGSAQVSPGASPTATPTLEAVTIDVRNGTTVAGLAGATATTLKKNKLFTIGKVGDASGSYTGTVVVDLTTAGSGKSAAVQALATQLKAQLVTKLPSGETSSTADAVVIVGK